MRKLVMLAITAISSTSALAAEGAIFSCSTENGKQISITKVGQDYEFSYGGVLFKNPVKQVVANTDSYIATGSGFVTSSLEMKHNGISYTVEFVQPRGSKNIEQPTLYITRGNNMQTIGCKVQGVVHNFEKTIMRSGS